MAELLDEGGRAEAGRGGTADQDEFEKTTYSANVELEEGTSE